MNYFKKQLIFVCAAITVSTSISSMPCHWQILDLSPTYDFDDLRGRERSEEIKRIKKACMFRLSIVKNASHKILEDIDQESKRQKKSSLSPRPHLQLSSSAPSMSGFGFSMIPRKTRSNDNKRPNQIQGEDLRDNLCERIVSATRFILKCLNIEENMIDEIIRKAVSGKDNQSKDCQNNTNSYDGDDDSDGFDFENFKFLE